MHVTEAQVHCFRARRGHLSGPGAASPVEVARAVVGIQAQVQTSALWSIAMRTQRGPVGRPTAAALAAEILESRNLVRTWAQRDTLHIYAPEDWPLTAAADPLWPTSSRPGSIPPEHALVATRERMRGRVITRADLFDLATEEMVADMAKRVPPEQAPRYAAGRLVWTLSHRGEVCLGPTVGAEQGYVLREDWLPELPFPVMDPGVAACELTRRYLAVNGPASVHDVAHFFGSTVTHARTWLAALRPELIDVTCPGHPGLVALAVDASALRDDTPPPPRLVAAYDTRLMAHADKTWMVPQVTENKAIWRASAVVAAVVLAGGVAVATWTQKKVKKAVQIEVAPLSGWRPELLAGLEADAHDLALHLGLAGAELRVA